MQTDKQEWRLLACISPLVLPAQTKIAVLRWRSGREWDCTRARQSRQLDTVDRPEACGGVSCQLLAVYYPWGDIREGFCATHMREVGGDAQDWPQWWEREGQTQPAAYPQEWKCVFCATGPASVEDWLLFCPFLAQLFRIVTSSPWNCQSWTNPGLKRRWALACHALHQARMWHFAAKGAPLPMERVAMLVWQALPPSQPSLLQSCHDRRG